MTTATTYRPTRDQSPATAHPAEPEGPSCERMLDLALEDSFPASDPVSSNDCN